MKRLTYRDLGCPSDEMVEAETFEEIAAKCQTFVAEKIAVGDETFIAAVAEMKSKTPEEQQAMFAEYKKKFDEAPEV